MAGGGVNNTSEDVSSWFHGYQGFGGDKTSELLWTSGLSSPQRFEEAGL